MTCSTCKHWLPKASGEMAKHRFAICANGPRYKFLPPHAMCQKHTEAEQKVIEARIAWISKG